VKMLKSGDYKVTVNWKNCNPYNVTAIAEGVNKYR
jgi:hypothetical protein